MSDKKVFIVTGGGSGIGAATARLLCAAGQHVVVTGRRPEPLVELAAETGALAQPGDVTEPGAADVLVEVTHARFGRIDGLVLNAGVMVPGPVGGLSDRDWDTVLGTNLTAPFRLVRAALPHLLAERGSVVAVSSVAGLRASAGAAAYATSKAGLVMLCQTLVADYAAQGLRANTVCPGWVRSEMADAEMDDFLAAHGGLPGARDAAYAEVTRLVPQARAGYPEEAAAAIAWLLSDAAAYVNGAVLTVDGGSTVVDVGTAAYTFDVRRRS
ncbi:SDR family NAD(P)-dependent oxidoreductase [Yinghuangia seranimata]|uniref:SDR family NAD(P)-dependent oxidoreductase n=1 Tax=Yinghuangia seranimata TaxID=408067 RepID=UPI00248C9BC0|nr:SDR family oxidoreductase [Yinghuangia seranimata]MDI2129940.1 SDR family oxidoreductase [Yinghuangia seranimata]